MGYSFFGRKTGFHLADSDEAYDLFIHVWDSIIDTLRKEKNSKGDSYNTDGIVNVALILQEMVKQDSPEDAFDFLLEIISDLDKYIEKLKKAKNWDDEENKREHIRRFKKVLKNLMSKTKQR